MSDIEKRLNQIEQKIDAVAHAPSPYYGGIQQNRSDEIDLRELWNVLWGGKWWVVGITFLFAVAGVFYALSLPNIYRSEALLASTDDGSRNALSGVAGQFGGLASLAGVNLNSANNDKTVLAMEVLESRRFITYFINKHELLIPLMAAEDWDWEKDKLLLDPDVYDIQKEKWIRDVSPPKNPKPSVLEAYEEFSKIFSVSQDKTTQFVSVSIDFYSPVISKQWVDWLVEDINLELKRRDVIEARRSIKYLTRQLEKTSIADMQSIFYELIEEQTKVIMFAETRDEYVFKTIDGAVVSEMKIRPNKLVICILSVIVGSFLGVFFVFLKVFLINCNK